MSPAEKRARGDRAKRLLDDDLVKEVLGDIETKLVDVWKASKAEEVQRREDAWRSLRLLEKLKAGLRAIANDGLITADQLAFDETRHRGPRRVA